MKKFFVAAVITLILPLTVYAAADEAKKMGGKHTYQMEKIAKKLNLTEQQKSELSAILKERHQKHQALKEETHTKMANILTSEQMVKMQKMKGHGKDMLKNNSSK